MTDRTEREYQQDVALHFYQEYGPENVDSSKYLRQDFNDGTGIFPDFWIEQPDYIFAVEVENGRDSLYEGIGQAQAYAAQHTKAIPVVVFPENHLTGADKYILDSTPVHWLAL